MVDEDTVRRERDADRALVREMLATAHAEGHHVGALTLSLSLNPYHNDDPRHAAWARGWRAGLPRR